MLKPYVASTLFMLILALFLSVSFSDRAHAATYKCTENGKVSYSDKPCKNAESKVVGSNTRATLSTGMHPSWFAVPAYSKQRVRCTAAACECGKINSKLDDKGSAVINAMSALPGAWASHHSTHKRFKELGLDKKRFPSYIDRLDNMACRIKISQKIIQDHYQDYSTDINEKFILSDKAVKARAAECDAKLKGVRKATNKTAAMDRMKRDCSIKTHNKMIRSHKRTLPEKRLLEKNLETLKMSRSTYIKQRNAKKK